MKVPNDFQIRYNCGDCNLRNSSFFCNLSPATLQSFKAIKIMSTYPKGARLFIEGQPSEGVFMLCRGRAKLTMHSRNGKALILRVAVPGEVLGLSATVSNFVHETTAEAIEPCQVNFVRKSDFCRFLNQNADAAMNAIQQLSQRYSTAHAQIRAIGLSSCVADKLAGLLLDWSKDAISNNGSVHLKVTFSHEEIGEMIGTSRETVTRVLKDFRESGLIEIKGSDLYVPNKHELEATIGDGSRTKTKTRSAAERAERSNGHLA